MTPEQIADSREACANYQVVHANDAAKLLDEVERLQALTTRLVALVKWLEFSKHYKSGNSRVRQCPICGGIDPKGGCSYGLVKET